MEKIQVYHFHNGTGGGVLSVIKNLLQFSVNPYVENHVIYTINKDETQSYSCNYLKGATSETVFYYSPKSNFLHTCSALAKLIPHKQAILVTHDWLELGMISNLGLQNPVITFLHGDYDYYYDLAKLHQGSIDRFVVIAANIAHKLKDLLSFRAVDIRYLRFPVPDVKVGKTKNSLIKIAFVGRLSPDKGYPLLPVIDTLLRTRNLKVSWHIAGDFVNKDGHKEVIWSKESSHVLYGQIKNEDVLSLLAEMDFFVLPSSHEGLPVTLVEAMKCGVIPLVNDIEGGIQELVEDGVTGFKINGNEAAGYADKIVEVTADKILAEAMRQNCINKANSLFDPQENTMLIETEMFEIFSAAGRKKNAKAIYGSRLDKSWVPNFITKTVRTIR